MQQEAEIVAKFRTALEDYLRAANDWDEGYNNVYRLSVPGRVSPDLQPKYERLEACKRILKAAMPAAQVLCHRYRIRENWDALLRIEVQTQSPQGGAPSIIGRSERSMAMSAMSELELAVLSGESSPAPLRRSRGLLQMIRDLF